MTLKFPYKCPAKVFSPKQEEFLQRQSLHSLYSPPSVPDFSFSICHSGTHPNQILDKHSNHQSRSSKILLFQLTLFCQIHLMKLTVVRFASNLPQIL